MVTAMLAKEYGYTVSWDVQPHEAMKTIGKTGGKVLHYVNTAVGGMDSNWGAANVQTHVNDYQPDLVVLAFGMNDGHKTRDHYMDLTKKITESMRENTDADIILLATMLPHWRAAGFFGHQIEYVDRGIRRRALIALGKCDYGDPDDLLPRMEGIEILGASSDHTILDIQDLVDQGGSLEVGDIIEFDLKYSTMVYLTNSANIEKVFVGE
jgi:hypothetical protein